MSLEFKQIPDADLPPEQTDAPLRLADLQEFHAEMEAFIDRKVAALRERYTGLPSGSIRQTLIKGQCLCSAVTRLLKEDLR